MSKEKYQHKTPHVPTQGVLGIGKFKGKGPYVPSEKEMKEAIANARKIGAANEELRKTINTKKRR